MALANVDKLNSLIIKLHEINAIKFGNFTMKSGCDSPIYFDLRVIISYPNIMKIVSELIISVIEKNNMEQRHICGVPYTALPLATLVSVEKNLPMLIRRKEAKNYGTKKIIEGVYNSGDHCLIVEDVITSGSSVLETVRDLKSEGIITNNVIVVIDREQGGSKNIKKSGVNVHSLFSLTYLLQTLNDAGKITQATMDAVKTYISKSQISSDGYLINGKPSILNEFVRTKLTFENRAEMAKNAVAKRLFGLMAKKHTNLCVAADLTSSQSILDIAQQCGPYICLLKTHVDIIEDFDAGFLKKLRVLADQYEFVLMEDRKFADIGNTVSLQYSKGIFKISDWAELVTAHTLPGRSILQGLRAALTESVDVNKRGVFLISELSATGNLIDEKYREKSDKIATEGSEIDFVAGIVCQSKDAFTFPGIIQLTPGVKIDENSDNLGQQYKTPEHVINELGADIAVVGRGILQAKNVPKAAALYRDALWAAYRTRVGAI